MATGSRPRAPLGDPPARSRPSRLRSTTPWSRSSARLPSRNPWGSPSPWKRSRAASSPTRSPGFTPGFPPSNARLPAGRRHAIARRRHAIAGRCRTRSERIGIGCSPRISFGYSTNAQVSARRHEVKAMNSTFRSLVIRLAFAALIPVGAIGAGSVFATSATADTVVPVTSPTPTPTPQPTTGGGGTDNTPGAEIPLAGAAGTMTPPAIRAGVLKDRVRRSSRARTRSPRRTLSPHTPDLRHEGFPPPLHAGCQPHPVHGSASGAIASDLVRSRSSRLIATVPRPSADRRHRLFSTAAAAPT